MGLSLDESRLVKLIKLPGIGNYTANILLALIYNQPRVALDGNVKRFLSRLFNINIEGTTNLFKTKRNGDLAEALMEFGAVICKPNNPLCNICNLKTNCYFYKNKTSVLANKKRQEKEKKYNVYCYLKKKKREIA